MKADIDIDVVFILSLKKKYKNNKYINIVVILTKSTQYYLQLKETDILNSLFSMNKDKVLLKNLVLSKKNIKEENDEEKRTFQNKK